ncbi:MULTISPECIES: helix-turn-helix transcriptional regulator [Streptomyces]|uniref:helix-turn-helix domain-containing protein n=1 Tax=Streptomyces TaxID=1883 RepID=UPI002079FF45|nr:MULTISPECIES: helix-turn-helix transcriptional regulator [Streptomyces]MCM9080742.1 helix-turn-helix transcriptional regulator [Streptomyces spororaveus]MCX5304831.1 helix-turn-helix transcriptional regulator [Streptomyces sp. NBC_00160]
MPARKDPDASANVPSFYGAELRYKRESAGLTLDQLVEGSFRGVPFLSQIERGERRMPLDLARHVDARLGTDGFFERRCEDARRAKQSGYAEYFADVAEMEPFAETIEEWAPMLVPGLLQTPAYARAISRAALPRATDETIEKLVSARMGRAALFDRECPPDFWVVLDESVIRRPALPATQMAELLEHIAAAVRRTRSILQVVPQTTAAHALMMGMAKLMSFPDAPPVVYVESLHSGQLIDFPALVKEYRRSYDLLRAAALPPEASLDLLDAAAEGYRDGKQRN